MVVKHIPFLQKILRKLALLQKKSFTFTFYDLLLFCFFGKLSISWKKFKWSKNSVEAFDRGFINQEFDIKKVELLSEELVEALIKDLK